MSAYVILLILFAIAWAIVGFSVAMLLLKLRWNLVSAVLLISVGIVVPTIVAVFTMNRSHDQSGVLVAYGITIFGMLEVVYEVMVITSCGGFMLGILVGTTVGLWPSKDDEGNRQRSAKNWTGWKLVAAGPFALAVVVTLFFLADLRAQQRLAGLRAKHQAILEVQEDVAPRLQNDAALVHDALMLALLEDDSPDWVLKGERDTNAQIQPVPMRIVRRDYDVLRIFQAGFPETSHLLEYVDRHEQDFLKLRTSVLVDGLEYRHWDEQVARFATVHALAQIHRGDNDSALKDLQLLRAMATQSLDKRIEESFSFVQIEEFRYLVFQAFLGHVSPVPEDVYQEMLTSIGDTSPSLRRSLKRQLSRHVVSSINALLEEPTAQQHNLRDTYRRMAERIIYQEHTPQCVARVEDQINQAFDGSTDPLNSTVQTVFPAMWDPNEAWLLSSGFSGPAYLAVQVRYQHNVRQELVKAVRTLESQREEKGRFLTQQEFLTSITSKEFTSAIAIDYLTLHNPTSGKAEGAILATPEHRQLQDYMGLYLGPAFFSILDDRWPTLTIRTGLANGGWELAQVKKNPMRLMIPTPKASTSNPSAPMR